MRAPLVKQASSLVLALALFSAGERHGRAEGTTAGQSLPSGPVSFSITNPAAPVYDLTGSYQFDQEVTAAGGRTVKVGLAFSVAQDAAGRLHGSGVTNVLVDNEPVAASYRVSGRVTGGGNKAARAMLSIRWQAQDPAATNGPFTISVQYNLEVRAGLLNGQTRGRASFFRLGSGSIKTPIAGVPLPAGADGTWRVRMNIQWPGGTGSIILPNGRSLQTGLTDSFSARSGLARIKHAGTGGDRGTTLSVIFSPASGALDSLSGRVLGQTVALRNLGGSIVGQSIAQGPSSFAGAQACLECHTPIQQILNRTVHAQVGVECENCHGPAANHAANDYDPVSRPRVDTAINSCARCHNDPSASWTISSQPPGNTPQQGILLGVLGELAFGLPHSDPAYHALFITNQCIGCHLQGFPFQNPAETAISAHSNYPVDSYGVCAGCHGSVVNTSNLVVFANWVVSSQISGLKISLDTWATNKAPAILGTAEYGTRAWEYTSPGELSPGGPGPNAAQQALIPVNIQKARFNLYLAFYDGSFGVHNGPYTVELLQTAQTWVDQELIR